jgi:tRNA threonylcarbamoyladenosine biosynthesis protein TsaB
VSAFVALAAAIPAAARAGRAVAVAIDTKRGDVYLQCFDAALAPLGEGRVAAAGEIAALLPPGALYAAGDGAALIRQAAAGGARDIVFDPAPAAPDPGVVASLGARRLAEAPGAQLPPPEPRYLRAPEATPLALQGRPRGGAR